VLLRIKRHENLLQKNSKRMGALFGVDRITEVNTLRRKIKELSQPVETLEFMEKLAYARSKEYEGDANVVMIDGHVVGYSGGRKVGSTWSARNNKVVNAHTENWVNLLGNAPLFSLETPFNNGLVTSLEDILKKTKNCLKIDNLTAVFDRGGSSAILFESLTEKGFGIITYQKGNYKDIDEDNFIEENIKLGAKEYNFLPYEQEVEMKIYEETDNGKFKKPSKKDTKRIIKMRDIRIRCNDDHQISIIANEHVILSAEEIANVIFHRIGYQENIFKYMREEYDVDGLVSYDFVNVDEDVEHPNPKYIKQEKKLNKLNKNIRTLLSKCSTNIFIEESQKLEKIINSISEKNASTLLEEIKNKPTIIKKKESIKLFKEFSMDSKIKQKFALKIFNTIKKSNIHSTEKVKQIFENIIKVNKLSNKDILEKMNEMQGSKDIKEIKRLYKKSTKEKKILSKIPIKENAYLAGYQKPKPEPKRLMNIVKLSAYVVETKLFDILSKYYKYNDNEGRKLIAGAMRSTGSLELQPGEIVIKLDEQANPRRTEAINKVLRELNKMKAKFPGSARIIRFEETTHE
jgi:prepilin-type processing-associated H-X9-DG protein